MRGRVGRFDAAKADLFHLRLVHLRLELPFLGHNRDAQGVERVRQRAGLVGGDVDLEASHRVGKALDGGHAVVSLRALLLVRERVGDFLRQVVQRLVRTVASALRVVRHRCWTASRGFAKMRHASAKLAENHSFHA